MKKYDLILGFGNACSCTQCLRAAGLQHLSFPFDWVVYSTGEVTHDLRHRADMVANGFRDWLNLEDLKFNGNVDWHDRDIYLNTRTGVLFNHEFPKGSDRSLAFPAIAAKYDRRIKRMMELIRKSKSVLAVRIDRPDQDFVTSLEDITYLLRRLQREFPGTEFDVLHLTRSPGIALAECREERLSEHVLRLAFEYRSMESGALDHEVDVKLVAQLLKGRYAVMDYRTPRERRAHRRADRMKEYARYGATTYWQYRIAKFRKRFAEGFSPRQIAARVRRHRYEQIVTLGVNCEVAFRFYRRWGFLDSSLFAWALTSNLRKQCETLGHLDRLFAGAATFSVASKMWKCEETGVFFHGQLNWARGKRHPQEALDRDLADLRGRVAHLREKFLAYLRNEKETLIVQRLSEEDQSALDLNGRIGRLERAVLDLGARNVVYLFVCERLHLGNMPAAPGRNFRAVERFNPGDRVVDTEAGDTPGWRAIFSEFAPRTILPKRHSFKFE